MAYEISVDKGTCIGCGNCAAVCPRFFRISNGKAQPVIRKSKDPGCAKQAEAECPVGAITVKEV